MANDDKARNQVEKGVGKLKEGVGGATGDEQMRQEGKAEQSKSDLKQGVEKVKDAFRR